MPEPALAAIGADVAAERPSAFGFEGSEKALIAMVQRVGIFVSARRSMFSQVPHPQPFPRQGEGANSSGWGRMRESPKNCRWNLERPK